MTLAGSVHEHRKQVDEGAERVAAPVVAADLDRALELLASAERARAEAVVLLGGLADTGLAQWLGYTSTERLIAHRTRAGNRAAHGLVRVARFLERFPTTARALLDGRVTFAVAEVLARTAVGCEAAYLEYETVLLDAADGHEPAEVERICRLWRSQVDPDATGAEAETIHRRRGVWMQTAFDGSCDGRFVLDATGAEAVWSALDSPPDPAHTLPEPRTLAQQRADTLVTMCEQSLNTGQDQTASGRAAVDVVIDIHTLAGADAQLEQIRSDLNHGGPITGPGLDRLLCDASFRALITDGPRTVLAYNRATPDIPPALRRAVRVRDRHCTFHGCDRPWNWCDLHHIVPRNRGGPTTAENLTLLCRFHHTAIHEGGWQLTRAPGGTIHVTSP